MSRQGLRVSMDGAGPSTSVGNSARSSITIAETENRPHEQHLKIEMPTPLLQTLTSQTQRTPFDDELERDEKEIERYGGDDVHDPTPRGPDEVMSPSREETIDSNRVEWDGPNDPANPQNFSVARKWAITVTVIIMTVNVTFASSAPSTASRSVMKEFGTTAEVSYLLTTVFLLGYVFGPLFWGPGSEVVGRKPVFVFSMVLYTVFHLGQALAQNIETLLVTRFLSGFFAVAPLTNSGGVIADIWSAVGRGPATSLFTTGVFLGPVMGPIVAGYIIESGVSWRWVFWVMMIFAGVCTTIMIIFLPETYAPVILLKKAKRLRKEDPIANKNVFAEHENQDWSIKGVLHRTLFRPFIMLAIEPVLLLITIYLSVVYGLLYALFQAFPIVFIQKRGFTAGQDGLIFIGVGIGTTLGAFINFMATRHYPELIMKWRGFPPPEERLLGAMIGSPLLVIACFWLGWTGEYTSVPWYVPGLSTIAIGCAISLIFMSFLSYLVDMYLMYSASAFAANTFVRCAVAAAFPLFTVQMFTGLGVNWASTLIALIALLFAPSPFLFYKYGARIRSKSKFAPCVDLKIAKILEAEEREKQQTSTTEKV